MSVDWDYDNWHAKINSNITKPFVCTLNFKSYDKFINTITYNEEVVSSYPEKGNLNVKVDCNNFDGSWDYNNWKPVLTGANKDTICDIKFEDIKFNIGDYISYSSKSNNYKISKDLTGYSADQTINPSELNLWRVIRINDDSTVDMVSEYTSSNEIICTGKAGYENIVLTLNTIAKQYETPGITVGSRHMGYNGQPDVQSIDIFYNEQRHSTDVNLVKNAIGTLTANKANGTTPFRFYWIAERFGSYVESVNANCYYVLYYSSTAGGVASGDSLYSVYISNGQNRVTSQGRAIRPIVTLKADINTISGIGSKDNPYKIG